MSTERPVSVVRGAAMLVVNVVVGLTGAAAFVESIARGAADRPGEANTPVWWLMTIGAVLVALAGLAAPGYFTLQPNEARALVLFGSYKGTAREGGFHWASPFLSNAKGRYKISLRARTLLGDRLKVNDRRGNPIEIAAMVVWHVHDTAQAMFDVDDFDSYVTTQAETALRHVATAYAYDHGDDENDREITLRGNPDEVSKALREDLGARLAVAGVVVDDARLTHLAYAPEIAQAMLRRQQAEAVIAARRKIVTGAVSMVDMALKDLAAAKVVDLDDERKAAMVSNLMVVLCGEGEVTPIVNTGTLYQ